jgi:hypothetical protein
LSTAAERSGRRARPEEAVIPGLEVSLWEQMLSPENLGRALRRVRANGGAPGVDGMTTDELVPWREFSQFKGGFWCAGLRSFVMIRQDEPRDLSALVVPQAGWLEHAEDPWEPYRLRDPAGALVAPVAAFLRDLQASGRPETTLRAYAIALLRWHRFLWAAGVAWDQATRAEARDFSRWIQITIKPGRAGRPGDAADPGIPARVAGGRGRGA